MKKKKARFREKIKSKPRSRNHSGKKKGKKTMHGPFVTKNRNHPPFRTADEGMEIMSHVILDFAGPLLKTCADEASEKKAISLAIFVWNAALLHEQERTQTLETYLAQCRKVVPAEELNTLSAYIDLLVQDKENRFADNRKKITNCTFGDFGDNRHIEVGYAME